jgi:hypothetical protein
MPLVDAESAPWEARPMIARSWTARATPEGARAYQTFFDRTLVPGLAAIAGHRGALVLTHPVAAGIEITVLTFWDSMEAVTRFAGPSPDRAVVEPEARAVLLDFDEQVVHHVVAIDARPPAIG